MPPHHRVTAPLCHCITMSPHHHVTVSVSHLPCPLPPNQSVICLAPCYQTSQSFDLPSTTTSPHHHITTSLHYCVTTSLHHCVSHAFALPPATKPVSHLPCPCQHTSQSFALPSTTASLCHCIYLSPHHCVTTSPHHHVTMSLCHHITMSLCQSVTCLAPCHQTSQSFALPPATKQVSTLTCPLPPCYHITVPLC